MTTIKEIPFRYDHVGSFLRPAALKEAREQFYADKITAQQLKETEDQAIKELVQQQVTAGLKAVTDGEFRRSWWHLDFLWGLNGVVETKPEAGYNFHHGETRAGSYTVVDKITYNPEHPFFAAFTFLQEQTPQGILAKATIPSPTLLFNRKSEAVFHDIYADEQTFIEDLAAAYRQTILKFYELGCRYLQLDDTSWGMYTGFIEQATSEDEIQKWRHHCEAGVAVVNLLLQDLPEDLTITMHVCRGNYKSDWAIAGPYDHVADYLAQLAIDGYFLEYDDDRSGGFAPLAKIHENGPAKKIVLGLVTSKFPELEAEESLIARIEEAQTYVPLENLCLSPQCGFASTEEGNYLTEEQQWAKIKLVIDTAKKVWNDAE
ncbi:5-methyltetrahydropteroyltriglutamate--homocysteine S-methyltransferase [Enterococcus sp. UD-01]|jgi:5-methyltetrahydropteroyltriglutamate--homocysteine methyltransferase|uniref:5-methyltetrahydropteroyltriglutamate-- homocysteine S-methyltransferase n=1 Tax=Enterococcus sp. UD-01 TaxID=3373911 RepID=UPI0038328A99